MSIPIQFQAWVENSALRVSRKNHFPIFRPHEIPSSSGFTCNMPGPLVILGTSANERRQLEFGLWFALLGKLPTATMSL